MSGHEESLDERRRRLVWRAGHRGMRELDLVLARYVDETVWRMDEAALKQLEQLLEAPDADLYEWILGMSTPPQPYDGPHLSALRNIRLAPSDRKD